MACSSLALICYQIPSVSLLVTRYFCLFACLSYSFLDLLALPHTLSVHSPSNAHTPRAFAFVVLFYYMYVTRTRSPLLGRSRASRRGVGMGGFYITRK